MADSDAWLEGPPIILMSFECLLRVQSEGLPLQLGEPTEALS